jgi:hypothetical protein
MSYKATSGVDCTYGLHKHLTTIDLLAYLIVAASIVLPLAASSSVFDDHCSAASPTMANTEQTFIMIKPDGVARGLVGEIIKRFEQKVGTSASVKFNLSLFRALFDFLFQLSRKPFCLSASDMQCTSMRG